MFSFPNKGQLLLFTSTQDYSYKILSLFLLFISFPSTHLVWSWQQPTYGIEPPAACYPPPTRTLPLYDGCRSPRPNSHSSRNQPLFQIFLSRICSTACFDPHKHQGLSWASGWLSCYRIEWSRLFHISRHFGPHKNVSW